MKYLIPAYLSRVMRTTCLSILLFACNLFALAQPAGVSICPIIPLPVQYRSVSQQFLLSDRTSLVVEGSYFRSSARYLQQEILFRTHIPVVGTGTGVSSIILRSGQMAAGAYSLSMTATRVIISASDEEGMFDGVVSLLQLIALAMENQHGMQDSLTSGSRSLVLLPCWNIQDHPYYPYRGIMLDESRHFFGKAEVKKLLDQMAFYKLNRFHWHLTDEPGWRLDIQRYPLLSAKGGVGDQTDSLAPARYYSQEDIADIVAYAARRHIVVIPEIDMPGHASAANKAYPEYSGGGSSKHPEFTFNPGKDSTYQYLTDILKEVSILFPSHMIHLGGDEVSYGNDKWHTDRAVQGLMKDKKLPDLTRVEQYFVERMADSIMRLNCLVLGWDEVTHFNLDPRRTIVYWWRQDKPGQLKDALDNGFRVVLCPRLPFYFDFVQDSLHHKGRRWEKQYNSLDKVYGFSTGDLPVTSFQSKQILGIQANLWTETVQTKERMEYLLFPRLLAVAEAAWTPAVKRNFAWFSQRLPAHLLLLHQQKVVYYDPSDPGRTPEVLK